MEIVIFAYDRPSKISNLLFDLANNELPGCVKSIRCFVDGPKGVSDKNNISSVLGICARYQKKLPNFTIVSRTRNLGLSRNILLGIDDAFSQNDAVICLEDDLRLHKKFIFQMCIALNKFKNNPKIGSVTGYNFDIKRPKPFLINGASCWGWATWKDRWLKLELSHNEIFDIFKNNKLLKERLTYDFNSPHWKILKNSKLNKTDSWAIRWHAVNILNDMSQLCANVSLVENDGFDGSGTNCGTQEFHINSNFNEDEWAIDWDIYDNFDQIENDYKIYLSHMFPSFIKRVKRKLLG